MKNMPQEQLLIDAQEIIRSHRATAEAPPDADKNKRIGELEEALRQLVAHGNLFLKTHVSNRSRLEMLIAKAERALGGDDVGSDSGSTRKLGGSAGTNS